MIFGLNQIRLSPSWPSNQDENRQILFYCSLFSSLTGIFWIFMGVVMKFALPRPVGSSVNSIALGIMFVGIVVLVIGAVLTTTILITGRIKNKTSALCSAKSSRPASNHNSDHSVKVSILP